MEFLWKRSLLYLIPLFWHGELHASELSPHYEQADQVVLIKSERKLYLFKDGEVLRSFNVALGLVPEGPKRREGDFRTPEGSYYLETKNRDSNYFLSIKILF